jgi:uncharacterized membrane protein
MKSFWLMVSGTATLLALVVTLAVYAGWFGALQERIPVHWDLHGKPDSLVRREAVLPYLLIGPGTMLALVALTLVLPWLSPRSYDVDRFRPTYEFIMALVVLMMGYIQAVLLLVALGVEFPFLRVYLGGIFLFLAALGNVLGKVRRNFWMGVRTPWTLASETVWIRTHRLAAWTFTVGGLAGFVAAVLGADPLIAVGIILLAALTPAVYSLVIYKQLESRGLLNGPTGGQGEQS